VVIANGALMVMARGAVAVVPAESVTSAVKLVVPLAVGVPLIKPLLELSARPAGREPAVSDHVYGGTPPVAVSARLYGADTVPAGSGEVVVITRLAMIVTENDAVACSVSVSVTSTTKFAVPAAAGVPEISPVAELRDRPAGRAPPDNAHVYGPMPPAAAKVRE